MNKLFLLFISVVLFASCSDDDNNNGGENDGDNGGETPSVEYKYNEITDILDNCRTINWLLGGAGTHTGEFIPQEGVSIVSAGTNKFGKGYTFRKSTPFLQYNGTDGYQKVFQFFAADDLIGKEVSKYAVGFWIDRKQLQGLPLQFTSHGGGWYDISQADLLTKGYVAHQRNIEPKGYDQIEVTEVDGDFTHITIRSDKNQQENPQLFNIMIEDNSIGLKELTLWNPTLLYEELDVDPYHIYESETEHNASPLRGKTVMVIGDSQQNDAVISLGIARKTGANIIHAPMGGHRMKYNDYPLLPPYNGWMYHWQLKEKLMSVKAEFYFLMVSSNDDAGGGSTSDAAIQAVLDNYPAWGDDAATVNNKLSRFNALSEEEKQDIFQYKQTYSAFIKQLKEVSPAAKFVLATIPVSSFEATQFDGNGNTVYKPGITAESQKAERDWIFRSIRDDIYEIAGKFGATVCDLFNKSGITWENLPSKLTGEDSVHWTPEAKKEFIDPATDALTESNK